jgi:hypothetical protein
MFSWTVLLLLDRMPRSWSAHLTRHKSEHHICTCTYFDLAGDRSDVSAFILEPAKAHDLWTAVFESDGRTGSATLGLHGKAMYVQDLDNRMGMRTLHTGSDVMSICKRQVRIAWLQITSKNRN